MLRSSKWFFASVCSLGLIGFGSLGCSDNGSMSSSSSSSMPDSKMASMSDHKDIIDTATGPGMQRVTTLVTAIKAADLVATLKGTGPFTVFAPTNEAFAKLPPGTVDDLLKPENKEKLKSILLYHVHVGAGVMAKDIKTMALSTANGKSLSVKVDGSNVMVNEAKVIKTDVICTNGVIHWIDTVLLP